MTRFLSRVWLGTRYILAFFSIPFRSPRTFFLGLNLFPDFCRGLQFAGKWQAVSQAAPRDPQPNPLSEYFKANQTGPGIWKWKHYFEIYHRHLERFRGGPVNLVEVGIYSGGSLGMWRSYFGEGCHIHGVDIEESCKGYQSDHVSVWIGDQADRNFWGRFREQVPRVDVLIDDGGHESEQQMVTLEEILPHMPPGGVYICEDVHGISSTFTAFASGLVAQLNANRCLSTKPFVNDAFPFQQAVHSIHFYPFVCVIEKHLEPPSQFAAPKHGTEWQPFFDWGN